jgi:hypothetical protein
MKTGHRRLVCAGAFSLAIATLAAAAPEAGQAPASAASGYQIPEATYKLPRTPWGDPDLQGVWDYQSVIRMERPAELAGKARFTQEEFEEWRLNRAPNLDRGLENFGEPGAGVGAYNEFWHDRNFLVDLRTSFIEDPPNGRYPAMTPDAKKRFDDDNAYRNANGYETWEDWPPISRCIAETTPNSAQQYNSGTLIVQSPGWLVMFRERLDTRIIPLDDRPHVDSNIRQWNGDSRGRWEGDVLVVETTNFTNKQVGGGPGSAVPQGIPFGNFHLVERWVPVSETRLQYYATVTDPTTWVQPWTFMLPWERSPGYQVYEYACHEGNISIGNGLRGARYDEIEAAGSPQPESR